MKRRKSQLHPGRSSLFIKNDLDFRQPDLESLVSHRNYKLVKPISLPSIELVESSRDKKFVMVLDTNVSDSIDFKTSFLELKVRMSATTNDAFEFGYGSAFNFIQEVIVESRGGVEVDRFERANVWRLAKDLAERKFDKDHDYVQMGYDITNGELFTEGGIRPILDQSFGPFDSSTVGHRVYVKDKDFRFLIPMNKLSPFFDSDNYLCPGIICSRMKITLKLEELYRAVAVGISGSGNSADPSTKFTLTPVLYVHTSKLLDSAERVLHSIAASDSLEWCFRASDTTPVTVGGSTRQQYEAKRTFSRALSSELTLIRQMAGLGLLDRGPLYRHLNSETDFSLFVDYQFQFGDTFYPQQPIAGQPAQRRITSLIFRDGKDYRNHLVYNATWSIGSNLENHALIKSSGLPLNNSRPVRLLVNFNPAALAGPLPSDIPGCEAYLRVEYLKVCKFYLNNVVVQS